MIRRSVGGIPMLGTPAGQCTDLCDGSTAFLYIVASTGYFQSPDVHLLEIFFDQNLYSV